MEHQPGSTLSDDEYSVLMIASEGVPMMPIGRWQQPVENLIARGLLQLLDRFNNVITPAGRKALGAREAADNEAIKAASQRVSIAQSAARTHAEEAAQSLALAAQASIKVTADDLRTAVLAWNRVVLQRAMELVGE